MFDFADKLINKRALKKALKELDEELLYRQIAQEEKTAPNREYKTNAEAVDYKQLKLNNALSKPQTEAVDLKHFKDWRNINKVESKNPPYVPKKRFGIIDDDDDEGEQPEIGGPIGTNKNDLVNKIAAINNDKDKEEKKETSIADFFKEKYKTDTQKSVVPQEEKKLTADKERKTPSIKEAARASLNELLRKQREVALNTQTPEKKQEEQEENKSIKIEVVDFTKKKEEKPKKKTTTRKPRGKNKRRFDADVISSIDWK